MGCLLFLCAPLAFAEDAHERRVAVATFRADGVDPAVAAQIADLLAMELAKFEGVEVITPTDLRALLDQAALNALLGCEEPSCFVDFGEVLPARKLLAGSVGDLGGQLVVNASLIDVQSGRALTRVSQPLGAELGQIAASLRTASLVLATGDASLAPAALVAKGEVTAAMLERVRTAERTKGMSLHLLGGGLMAGSAFAEGNSPAANVGGAGRLEVGWPLLPWLLVTGSAGGAYYTGSVVQHESFSFVGPDPEDNVAARGSRSGDFGVTSLDVALGLRLRPSRGLILPYGFAALTGDWLILDVSDLVYQADADSPDKPPAAITQPIPFEQSMSPGVGARVGGGVDFLLTNAIGVSVELSLYAKLHGLELVSQVSNIEQRTPFAPLFGSLLLVGISYQL